MAEYSNPTLNILDDREIGIKLKEPEELDIEEPIQKWAKTIYRLSKESHKKKRESQHTNSVELDSDSDCENDDDEGDKYEDDGVAFEINLSRLSIRTEKPEFQTTRRDGVNLDKLTTQTLFETKYTNKTYEAQSFSFKIQRKTESIARVHFNRWITAPSGMTLSIPLPEDVQAAGFGKALYPNKAQETFKQEMLWSVDNPVKVPPKKFTTASLVIKEKEYGKDFKVKLTIKGKVLVNIVERDTGRFVRTIEGDIVEIFKKFGPVGEMKGLGINDSRNRVEFDTEGKCSFVFGVEQDVLLQTQGYGKTTGCTIL